MKDDSIRVLFAIIGGVLASGILTGVLVVCVFEPERVEKLKKMNQVVIHVSSSNPVGTIVAVDSKVLMELYAKNGWLVDSGLNGYYIMRKVENRNE